MSSGPPFEELLDFEDDPSMDVVFVSMTHLYEVTHHASKVKVLRPLQKKLEPALAKAFKAQGKSFMTGLLTLKSQFPVATKESCYLIESLEDGDFSDFFDKSDENSLKLFLTPLEAAVKAALLAAGMQQVGELGINLNFKLSNPRAVAYITAHGAELVSKINDETRSQINTILKQATAEGWSYDQTARAIIKQYDEFSVGVPGEFSSRAQFIAVTELGNAYEEGNFEPVQDLMDSGIEMEKSWDVAPELSETGPCDDCQGNADEGWIPADEPHQSGDDKPLAHPRCVCDEYYQAKGE